MMKKSILALIFAAISFQATAQNNTDIQAPAQSAYGQSGEGIILRSNTGLCWRTGSWMPENAIPGCDGPLTPPVVSRIAPDIAPLEPQTDVKKQCNFQVTLEDEQTFAFGKTVLRDAAKRRIDRDILSKFTTCNIKTVTITGYTDRIGTTRANQALSKRRADAVAEYLQGNGVLAKITTIGAGSANPIKECKEGNRTKLINCLAPNRRVSVIMQAD
jgi:OOP family OmpA-OmpF porin